MCHPEKFCKFAARVTWHDYIWWLVMVKLDINAHNFWHSGSNSIKVTILDNSHQFLSNDMYFVWFCGSPHFPIVFGNDIISGHMVFKFAYFVELWIDYQPAKFQCCRLSLARFIDRLRKKQWWRHRDIIWCCWDLKISNFVQPNIGYHPCQFYISWFVWIIFYGD